MDGFDYPIRYEVQAGSRLEAIEKAVAMLRSNVTLTKVMDDEPLCGGRWAVRLYVHEDPVDHPADATYESVR